MQTPPKIIGVYDWSHHFIYVVMLINIFYLQICQIVFCLFVSKLKQNKQPPPHPTKNNHTKKHKSPQQNQTKTKHKKHTKIIILSTNFCQHNLKYMWMISYPCNQTFIINLEDRCILKGRDTVFESKIK